MEQVCGEVVDDALPPGLPVDRPRSQGTESMEAELLACLIRTPIDQCGHSAPIGKVTAQISRVELSEVRTDISLNRLRWLGPLPARSHDRGPFYWLGTPNIISHFPSDSSPQMPDALRTGCCTRNRTLELGLSHNMDLMR